MATQVTAQQQTIIDDLKLLPWASIMAFVQALIAAWLSKPTPTPLMKGTAGGGADCCDLNEHLGHLKVIAQMQTDLAACSQACLDKCCDCCK